MHNKAPTHHDRYTCLFITNNIHINSYTVTVQLHKVQRICNVFLYQNSQAVKKGCCPQKAMVKKDVKSKVVAKSQIHFYITV